MEEDGLKSRKLSYSIHACSRFVYVRLYFARKKVKVIYTGYLNVMLCCY